MTRSDDIVRYARQISVIGVGRDGQAAIRRACIRVEGTELDAEVCALYLAGAGVGTLVVNRSLEAACRAINRQVEVEVTHGSAEFAIDIANIPDAIHTPIADEDPVMRGARAARWALANILAGRGGTS